MHHKKSTSESKSFFSAQYFFLLIEFINYFNDNKSGQKAIKPNFKFDIESCKSVETWVSYFLNLLTAHSVRLIMSHISWLYEFFSPTFFHVLYLCDFHFLLPTFFFLCVNLILVTCYLVGYVFTYFNGYVHCAFGLPFFSLSTGLFTSVSFPCRMSVLSWLLCNSDMNQGWIGLSLYMHLSVVSLKVFGVIFSVCC